MFNAPLALHITSSYCRLYATLMIVVGGGHKEVTTSSYHTICNFDLGFVAFFVVVILLCDALILEDGTVGFSRNRDSIAPVQKIHRT
jgi:hypothetical protein